MNTSVSSEQARTLLAEGHRRALSEILQRLHPAAVADLCRELSHDEAWELFEHASVAQQAAILPFLAAGTQVEFVRRLGSERTAGLLEAMSPDDRADLVRRLDPRTVQRVLPLMPGLDQENIRTLLAYPEHTAGSLLTTQYFSVRADLAVGDAIALLRRQGPSHAMIYYVYVVDTEGRLEGTVSLRDLIFADPGAAVRDIMKREVVSARIDQDQEDVARALAKYDLLALPVVDHEHRLAGIVTYDDALDVVVEEATEDALRMGSVGAMTENYLSLPFATVWRKRAAWLSCLFVAELLTFTALAHYQDAIAAILALSLFVPLCISTGGNSGSQAATLVTRALALGQIGVRDWRRVVGYELAMGLALGLTLGVVGFLRAALTPQAVLGNADRWMLAAVIAQAVTAICIWGTLVGATLPLVFRRLGVDPGYASSPFVATFVDVTGILIYFSIASAYLL